MFYRNKAANTYGILNASEDFLNKYPDLTKRVLGVYEDARKYSLANYDDEKQVFIDVTKLPDAVVDIQLKERTELTFNRIGAGAARHHPASRSRLAAGRRDSSRCRREEDARRSGRRPVRDGGLTPSSPRRGEVSRIAFADRAMSVVEHDC